MTIRIGSRSVGSGFCVDFTLSVGGGSATGTGLPASAPACRGPGIVVGLEVGRGSWDGWGSGSGSRGGPVWLGGVRAHSGRVVL